MSLSYFEVATAIRSILYFSDVMMNPASLNFKQLAGDATNLFNRAVQFTSEQIVGGEKTEYDSQLANLIRTADHTKVANRSSILKPSHITVQV